MFFGFLLIRKNDPKYRANAVPKVIKTEGALTKTQEDSPIPENSAEMYNKIIAIINPNSGRKERLFIQPPKLFKYSLVNSLN